MGCKMSVTKLKNVINQQLSFCTFQKHILLLCCDVCVKRYTLMKDEQKWCIPDAFQLYLDIMVELQMPTQRWRGLPQHYFDITDAVRAVGVSWSLWKHQQSRDHTFLHRSCTQLFVSTAKKNIFSRSKKNLIFFKNLKKKIKIWSRKSIFPSKKIDFSK